MRPTLLLVFSVLFFWAEAQDLANTLLWRIIPPNGSNASYLYGTFHTKNDRAFQFTDSVMPAMASCNAVYGELDLKAEQRNALGLAAAMRLPDEKRLEDLFKKKDWILVKAEMDEHMGLMAPMGLRMKPIFVLMLLGQSALEGDQPELLDQHLQSIARSNGQRIGGLETMEEQLRSLDAIPVKEQAQMLLDHCKKKDVGNEQEEMLQAYADQDLNALMKLAEDPKGISANFERVLITDRNLRMVHRMDSLVQSDTTCFFLVGAAHLPGTTGLIQGMRERGYAVEPVIAVATKRSELEIQER
ncbi:MAG: TraB/GumN family protein [Flavobacteriales bacterium]|nr:TraB/GumN family protein [Flavobacteriales bacterium]